MRAAAREPVAGDGGVSPGRYALFFGLATVGLAVDLWTKSWAFNRLGMPGASRPIWLWDRVFGFQTNLNEGALFGIGQGYVVAFAALSIAAALGVFYWLFVAGAARDRLLTAALGTITGGIFGNLYDRLGLPGLKWEPPDLRGHSPGDPVYAVRDFIQFQIEPLNFYWPTFNIADVLLVSGAALLVLHIYWHDDKQEQAKESG